MAAPRHRRTTHRPVRILVVVLVVLGLAGVLFRDVRDGVALENAPPGTSPTASPTASSGASPTASPTASSASSSSASPTASPVAFSAQSGQPWSPATASSPGYANTTIPATPVVSSVETAVVRRVTGAFLNTEAYAEPVYFAAGGTPLRTVRCTRFGCVGGAGAPITGAEVVAGGSDGQLVVVDTARRRSYELYGVARDPDGTVRLGSGGTVSAGAMSVVDLDSRGDETASGEPLNITGSGLSRLFGVIRAPEVKAAATDPKRAIPHALQVSLPITSNCAGRFRSPATKSDGGVRAGPCVEQGARIQLDPAFDCARVRVLLARAVCHALQTYGAFVIDNNGGTAMGFFGQHLASWPGGRQDYRRAGIEDDYSALELPLDRLRVLSRWDGR